MAKYQYLILPLMQENFLMDYWIVTGVVFPLIIALAVYKDNNDFTPIIFGFLSTYLIFHIYILL